MNENENTVLDTIFQALRTLNEERSAGDQIEISINTSLFGEQSELDSLSLVSVIVDLETLVSDKFDRKVSLTDDQAMSRDPVPFTNVLTLKAYILEQLAG